MDKSKIASVFILWGKVLLQKNHYVSKREREKNNKCFLQKRGNERNHLKSVHNYDSIASGFQKFYAHAIYEQ